MTMMISKFHKLVGSKKVWTVFAVLISVAFVIAYSGARAGSKQRYRGNPSQEVVGKLFGKKVYRPEFGQAYSDVYLMLILRAGKPINITPQIDQLIRQNAWQRLAILDKAKQMQLVVTDQQVADAIRKQPIFINKQTGTFDRNAYDAFFSQILPRIGLQMTPKNFELMIRENMLIDKATSTATQGALVTDAEVDHAFHVYADKTTVQYAHIPRSLATTPEVSEADAKAYYEANKAQFSYPDKVKVRYLEFPVEDFKTDVEVTDQMVTNFYSNYKDRFVVKGTEENAQPEYQPMDEVKDTIVDEIKTALARRKASTAAGMFVSKLSNPSVSFDQLAKDEGKTVTTTAPFAETDKVRGIDPTAQFARTAFSLENDDTHYYSDPVVGKNSVYVLALDSKMAAFTPDYDIVAKDVMAAAKAAAADKAYVEKAESVHADIQAALKAGTTFEAAAKQLKLKTETEGPFSVENPPSDDLGKTILKATTLFGAGTLVDLIPADNEFLVAYVASKEPADRALADPSIIKQLRASVQNDKADRMVAAWQKSVMEEAHLEEIDKGKKS